MVMGSLLLLSGAAVTVASKTFILFVCVSCYTSYYNIDIAPLFYVSSELIIQNSKSTFSEASHKPVKFCEMAGIIRAQKVL